MTQKPNTQYPTPGRPQGILLSFFHWFCDPKLRDSIEGDLFELYDEQLKKSGKRKADWQFLLDVLLLFRPGIIKTPEYKNLITYAMLKNYFKIGFRNLTRNKGYSFINMGGLAIGISVTLLIGLWIHDEVSFNREFENSDRIAAVLQNVTNNGEVQTWGNVPFPLAEELRTNYGDDFKHIAMAVSWGEHLLTLNERVLSQTGVYFEKEAPALLGLKMVTGSSNMDEPASILLSASTAKAIFGDQDPINQTLVMDEMPEVSVIGVYQDLPENSTFGSLDFICPWELLYNNEPWFKSDDDHWRPNFALLYVELNDRADFKTASARIKDAKFKMVNDQLKQKKPELFLHPMRDWHLRSEFENGVNTGGAIQYVWMFGIIGTFVLLLACINFMNLSTARNEIRAKEVGIRKSVGSLRKQLILQFFSESYLIVFISFGISLVLARLILPYFNEVANKQLTILWDNPFFWVISFVFILLTALIAGSYPALYLSSFRPVQVLKGTFKAGRFAALPRKILVVTQFTVSITLIIGTIIVYQQIQFTKNRPLGYSRANLVSISSQDNTIHEHFDAVKNELEQTGVVESIAQSGGPLTAVWSSTSGISWNGKDPNQSTDFGMVACSYGYGRTIGWELKDGRDFSREFGTDSSAVIFNEAAINYMGLENPVGQEITWWDNSFTIIGVIKNMVMESPYEDPRPIVYFLSEGSGNITLIKLKPNAVASVAITEIETVFKKLNPTQPFEYQFVDDAYNRKFGNEERIGKLAGFFAILAVLICCLGIFGLASFIAEQRTKEIGIRKVLGASVSKLWQMLSKDFVILVLIACLIAIPIAYYSLLQWLMGYEYRTDINWWVFVVAAAGSLIITLLTVSYQAIRAALANPVKSLRSE